MCSAIVSTNADYAVSKQLAPYRAKIDMAAGAPWTTCSSRGFGARSNTAGIPCRHVYLYEYETVAELEQGLRGYFTFYNQERAHQGP